MEKIDYMVLSDGPWFAFVLITTVPAMKSCKARLFLLVIIVKTSARNQKLGKNVTSIRYVLLVSNVFPATIVCG